VCSALQNLRQDIATAQSQAKVSFAGSRSVADVKQKLQPFATAMLTAVDRFASSIRAAGTPDVSRGKDLATRFQNGIARFRTAIVQVQSRYAQLPTDTPSSFKSALDSATASLDQSLSQVKSNVSMRESKQLTDAAAKEPACQSVKATS
jgi:hypothetical protein